MDSLLFFMNVLYNEIQQIKKEIVICMEDRAMNILGIISIILLLILVILGIEFMIKLKKSEGKLIDEVRKPLMIRLNIIIVLTIALSITTIINIILKG